MNDFAMWMTDLMVVFHGDARGVFSVSGGLCFATKKKKKRSTVVVEFEEEEGRCDEEVVRQ